MKLLKLNQKGITHLLAPIVFVGIFAVIGGVVLLTSHAAATLEYVGGQVRLNSSTGPLQQNATVTLRLYGYPSDETQYAYTNTPSAPGYYQFARKAAVGHEYVMSAYKVINHVRYCSGHVLVYTKDTSPLFEKDFVISNKSMCS